MNIEEDDETKSYKSVDEDLNENLIIDLMEQNENVNINITDDIRCKRLPCNL